MALNPYQKYTENRIEGASQGEMIIMLYEGAIRFMNQGIIHIENKDYEKSNHSIIKAQRIVNELQITLDFDQGGEIAENLYRLYDFCLKELINSNIKKSIDGLKNSIEIFEDLLDAWKEVVNGDQKNRINGSLNNLSI